MKNGHENTEMQKRKFDDVTLQYSIALHSRQKDLIPSFELDLQWENFLLWSSSNEIKTTSNTYYFPLFENIYYLQWHYFNPLINIYLFASNSAIFINTPSLLNKVHGSYP